ncbi:MAG: ATPase, T2SS/T4P/T4SS family [Bacillota bacterium]|nr:ATPase, T2SS/T4P/T4SS family [Bacillota bacterium]
MMPFYSSDEVRRFISEIRAKLADLADDIDDDSALDVIEEYVFKLQRSDSCGYRENLDLIRRLFFSLRKEMDILQPLVDDRTISEIMVNGKDDIFVERNGRISRVPLCFDTTEDLEELIRRISARVHREINELNPIVDARLSDGSRVNAVYGNIALNGPILTIRKFPEHVMTMEDLIRGGTVTEEAARLLRILVFTGYNIFICGGTSSGKTTMLNVLAQMIPSDERVVVIEDSAELQIRQIDNIVRMECRSANVQGKGSVDMAQLVRTSLRMRPDRIIIGEVRGSEVFDMINAMNTGHSGSLSTGHANSIAGMIKRLESMFMQAVDFPVEAIRSQISEGIDVIVHMSRMKNGSRMVLEISEIDRLEHGEILLNRLYECDSGRSLGRLVHREKLETMNGRVGGQADRIADDIRLLNI